MVRVGIVGAGVAGAGAAYALARAPMDAEVTVLERTDRIGGRAATRTRLDVVYDHGANYVKPDDDRVASLLTEELDTAGLVDVTEPVYTFDDAGTVSPGRDADEHKWTYERGLRELSRRLFERTPATIRRGMRIVGPDRHPDGWTLRASDGEAWGPFDAVVLTPPAPQTASLLADADWDAELREELVGHLIDVPYRAIYAAALHYPFAIDRPYYALVHTGEAHAVGWLSREECKRGHVPDGETLLIVQASHDWSVAHAEADPAANADRLADHVSSIVGEDRLASPDWTDHLLWQHALPEGGIPPSMVADARAEGLYLAGDGVAGEGRIHAALRSGIDAGDAIAADA